MSIFVAMGGVTGEGLLAQAKPGYSQHCELPGSRPDQAGGIVQRGLQEGCRKESERQGAREKFGDPASRFSSS